MIKQGIPPWIKWEEENEVPLGDVEVVLRDGTIEPTIWDSGDLDWRVTGDEGDITWYREVR